MKAGTPLAFQDLHGDTIKVGDRIKHADGTIYTIDKFGRAKSALGFIHTLRTDLHAISIPQPDGSCLYKLKDWEITDEPAPAAPEGETVTPGNDADNFAPPRVKDPRTANLKGKKRKGARKDEEAAVDNGVTHDEALRILTIQDF